MKLKMKKINRKSIAIITGLVMAFMFIPSGLFLGADYAHAATKVYLKDGDSYDISNAKKNTIVFINDDTASDGNATVELKGKSTYVWVNISVSMGHTVRVRLADGLSIKPGKDSAYGTGSGADTLAYSRAGIYIDETKRSGGTVYLTSEPGAEINVSSRKHWLYFPVPAIMKNNNKTKLIFDTEDKSNPGTIYAKPQNNDVYGMCGIGAFGHGIFGNYTSCYNVGKMEFRSGNIEAHGMLDGAGIGAYDYSNVKDLYFTGAHVEAYAGNSSSHSTMSGSAGIGTGYRGSIGTITISDGYVEAWGLGAAKGSNGRTQKEYLDSCGCGIGGGWEFSHIDEIKITGGTVKAYGGTCGDVGSENVYGCGIGTTVSIGKSGPCCSADRITITGGDITAVGGDYACGIGGCVKDIVIDPATSDTELKIKASIDDSAGRSGRHMSMGAGIGTSNNYSEKSFQDYPGNITIRGGDITAIAGQHGDWNAKIMYCGAGIGPTSMGKTSTIDISGGTINAVGGWNSPGIGGPGHCADTDYQTVDNIHISGGTITATKASYDGKNIELSGIGGYKVGNKTRTDIRITGGSVISNGTKYAIGYDDGGQPKNDDNEVVYGTKFKFDYDIGEWAKIDDFTFKPELSYDYKLNDVYAKKGLDDEEDDNIVEFWIPKSTDSSKYACTAKTPDRNYLTFNPAKIEAGDTTTLKAYTDITYVNKLNGKKYSGIGILGDDRLTINPAPTAIPRYNLDGYSDGTGFMVVNGGYGDTELTPLVQGTSYVNSSGKWKAKDSKLTLYLMLDQQAYVVKYDKNKPKTASHDVEGTMADDEFPVRGSSTLTKNDYSLAGWTFDGWNTKADGTGDVYGDEGEIVFGNWDTLTLYAQWIPKTYDVTYESGAAGISPDHIQSGLEYDATTYKLDTIASIGWRYPGYKSHGWTGKGFGSFYEDGEEFHNLCDLDENGNPHGKTLKAAWVADGEIKVSVTVDGAPENVCEKFIIKGDSLEKNIPNDIDAGVGHYRAEQEGLPPGNYQLLMDGATGRYEIPEEKQTITILESHAAISIILDYYTVTMHDEDHARDAYVETGTGEQVTSLEVCDDSQVRIGADADKGYHFDGYSYYGVEPEWEKDTSTANQKITVKGKVDITAHGEANIYHVVFEKNKPGNASHDVKGSMENQDFVFDEPQHIWENKYSLTGWTFTGWNSREDGSGESFTDEDLMDTDAWENLGYPENEAEVKLYAQWKPNNYRVIFSATNATSGEMDPQVLTYDAQPVPLNANAFERTDWHFTGWNTRPSGNGKAYKDKEEVTSLTTGKSITLYAQWEHDYYTVIFDKNDEQAKGEMPEEHVWTNCEYDMPLCTFYKKGYHMVSWNTRPDGSGKTYMDGEAIENVVPEGETITFYAQWKPNKYTVKYDANGGKGKMADQTFTYDVSRKLTANAFTKAHCDFAGWNTRADGKGKAYADEESVKNLTIYPDHSVTLYAQWDKKKHYITYDLNGGTLDGKTGEIVIECCEMDEITVLDAPTREGYKFEYWKGSKYYPGDKFIVKDDHTLSAQWKEDGSGTRTGDDTNLTLWLLLMLASGTGVLTLLLIRRAFR